VGKNTTGRAADIGCGFDGQLGRALFPAASELILVDIHVDPAIADGHRIKIKEGYLPAVLDTLPDASLDAIICNNVIEHLDDPDATLNQLRRLIAPGGVVIVNVPSWRGKFFLELAAFRFNMAPAEEMDDHRIYYDPRDLWPLLVRAGFKPRSLTVRRHKFGLNTIAAARV
jgi:2-polyprenyl-3-methyl-5-hydroxy-6-metoxy-1,4-benzoquinol methylase